MKWPARTMVDPILRYKVKLHRTPLDRYRVCVAHTVDQHENAFHLVRSAYVAQGIDDLRLCAEPRITPQHLLPESTIFVAYEKERLVGTLTVTLDSAAGLPMQLDYPQQIDALRREGATLVEYGSLAVVRRCWHTGVSALLSMAAHWFSLHVLQASHTVMEVHPKAVPFYRALYNFSMIGEARWHGELNAPAQAMVHTLHAVRPHLERHVRRRMQSGRRVHEHCCDVLPDCVELPPVRTLKQLTRWKLPRDVFRKLFVERTDCLQTLDDSTRAHLHGWRSLKTLRHALHLPTSRARPVSSELAPAQSRPRVREPVSRGREAGVGEK